MPYLKPCLTLAAGLPPIHHHHHQTFALQPPQTFVVIDQQQQQHSSSAAGSRNSRRSAGSANLPSQEDVNALFYHPWNKQNENDWVSFMNFWGDVESKDSYLTNDQLLLLENMIRRRSDRFRNLTETIMTDFFISKNKPIHSKITRRLVMKTRLAPRRTRLSDITDYDTDLDDETFEGILEDIAESPFTEEEYESEEFDEPGTVDDSLNEFLLTDDELVAANVLNENGASGISFTGKNRATISAIWHQGGNDIVNNPSSGNLSPGQPRRYFSLFGISRSVPFLLLPPKEVNAEKSNMTAMYDQRKSSSSNDADSFKLVSSMELGDEQEEREEVTLDAFDAIGSAGVSFINRFSESSERHVRLIDDGVNHETQLSSSTSPSIQHNDEKIKLNESYRNISPVPQLQTDQSHSESTPSSLAEYQSEEELIIADEFRQKTLDNEYVDASHAFDAAAKLPPASFATDKTSIIVDRMIRFPASVLSYFASTVAAANVLAKEKIIQAVQQQSKALETNELKEIGGAATVSQEKTKQFIFVEKDKKSDSAHQKRVMGKILVEDDDILSAHDVEVLREGCDWSATPCLQDFGILDDFDRLWFAWQDIEDDSSLSYAEAQLIRESNDKTQREIGDEKYFDGCHD